MVCIKQGDWIFSDTNWKWNGSTDMGWGIVGFTAHGGQLSNTVAVVPGTQYSFRVSLSDCTGTVHVALTWSGPGGELPSQGFKYFVKGAQGCATAVQVAPWEARWGTLYIVAGPGSCAKVEEAKMGPVREGALSVDAEIFLRGQECLASSSVGINCNYLVDDAVRREGGAGSNPVSFIDALQGMNVGALRYPGGEKADNYLWAEGPGFEGPPCPQPSRISPIDWPSNDPVFYDLAARRWLVPVMDFDDFMRTASHPKLRAEPFLVINWDGSSKNYLFKGQPDCIANSPQQLLAAAVGWARYCGDRYPEVRCFEFSNESFINHCGAGALARQYVEALVQFSKGMRAANPNIRLGANGPNCSNDVGDFDLLMWPAEPKPDCTVPPRAHCTSNQMHCTASSKNHPPSWWKTVLELGSEHIDFLALHPYVIAGWTYSDYAHGAINLVYPAQEANWAIDNWAAPGRRDRIGIAVTETAPIDYGHPPWDPQRGPRWPWQPATLGHALVLLDQMASLLMLPRVQAVMFWNTRWMTSNAKDPQCRDNSVVDALHSQSNTPTACGKSRELCRCILPRRRPCSCDLQL
eukprot:jgi/Botrbrau1/12758/Bobra.67_1s0117.1